MFSQRVRSEAERREREVREVRAEREVREVGEVEARGRSAAHDVLYPIDAWRKRALLYDM
jgi:hypothetical protein